ncbi:uncharacterized protein LOC130700082 [Daphnia carinata]|uniref:uncharacterized protein LOC130700082 n=1 Tax=Daphnia carinata TaxID=120202 RepID=UPI00257EE5A6|nr:uncharacterized protein LOC130700082 [Daphnia carinata]
MEEGIEDWEDRMCKGFQQTVQVQDQETGECWTVAKDSDCTGVCSDSKMICTRIMESVSSWKIPIEYSLLGSHSSFKAESVQPIFATVDADSLTSKPSWICEDDKFSDKTAIIATLPSPGKLPGFCRKRRCSASSGGAKTDLPVKPATNPIGKSALERFLEGRERLLFVGRLLFAFLVLLSPGYFFPLLFFIRTYCHYWKHSTADQEEEIVERTYSGPFSFFQSKTFLKYSCRVCRERMKTEQMFRIHSKIGPSSFKKNAAFPLPDDYDCTHNHDDY